MATAERLIAGEVGGLRIRMLGGFQIAIGDRTIGESEWYLRKAKKLVKLLILAPDHRLHRGEVAELLWPELDEEAATNNIHKAVHIARRVLEPNLRAKQPSSYLYVDANFVSFISPGPCWIDVPAFMDAADHALITQDPDAYEGALSLYRGDLLPEDRYEPWIATRRDDLRSRYFGLMLELAALWERAGRIPAAINVLRRLVITDRAHEQAHAELMRLLAASGQRQLAIRQYAHLCEALREELDVEPDESTETLYRQILAAEATLLPSIPVAPPADRGLQVSPGPGQRTVGRSQERARLEEKVADLASGRGGLVLVEGPAGIGKSHLVADLLRLATASGAIPLRGTAYGNLEYDLFTHAFERLALQLVPEELVALLGDHLETMIAFVPMIAATLGRVPPAETPSEALVGHAVSDVVIKLSRHGPVVAILENLHLARAGSLAVLDRLMSRIDDHPVLLVGTFRSDGVDKGSPFAGWRQRLVENDRGESIELGPLGRDEIVELATKLAGASIDDSVMDFIWSVAGGSPYYSEEVVRALLGRGRIVNRDGTWQVREGTRLNWGQEHLRRRDRITGDFRLTGKLRGV